MSTTSVNEDMQRPIVQACSEFLRGLSFVVQETARDPSYSDRHLLYYVSQDFIQSIVAIQVLATQGMLSSSKRELRFVLEASIKLAHVQQHQCASDIATKLDSFRGDFNSANTSIKNKLDLSLIEAKGLPEFHAEVGKIYGETSNYVHLTVPQILGQIRAIDAGRTSGHESPGEVRSLSDLLQRGLACSFVFILHAVPSYVAGDWLVEDDGSTVDWYFTRSRWISAIDEHFDYKYERQDRLAQIRESRAQQIAF